MVHTLYIHKNKLYLMSHPDSVDVYIKYVYGK